MLKTCSVQVLTEFIAEMDGNTDGNNIFCGGAGGGEGHDTRPRIRENLWCFVSLRTLKIVSLRTGLL